MLRRFIDQKPAGRLFPLVFGYFHFIVITVGNHLDGDPLVGDFIALV